MQAILERLRRWAIGHPARVSGLTALAGLIALYFGTVRPVVIVVDGQEIEIRTHARTVEGALRDAGWPPKPEDRVVPAREAEVVAGGLIRLDRAHQILVEREQGIALVRTAERVPANVLALAGVRLYPGDVVWVDGLRSPSPNAESDRIPWRLRVEQGDEIKLIVDGAPRRLRSAAATLGEALWEAGVVLHEGDRLAPGPETPLTGPLTAVLRRSQPVTILADGREHSTRSAAATVGEALAEAGLTPVGLDFAIPSLTSELPEDGRIRLVRVREEILVEQVPIPFETVYEPVSDLEIDNQRLLDPGAYGVSVNQIRIRLEDGQETIRVVEGERVAVQPEPRVIGYGMQIVIRTLDTPDGPVEYWRAVTMYATSYSPSRAGTSPDAPWYGITASGKPLTKGLVAIDLSLIPFGTRMYVPGYGMAEAADVGGGVRGRWIDLGYDDDNFVNWHQYVTVYFLTPVPPASNIVWIFP